MHSKLYNGMQASLMIAANLFVSPSPLFMLALQILGHRVFSVDNALQRPTGRSTLCPLPLLTTLYAAVNLDLSDVSTGFKCMSISF